MTILGRPVGRSGRRASADPACPAGLDRRGHSELLLRLDWIDHADSQSAEYARELSAIVRMQFEETFLRRILGKN